MKNLSDCLQYKSENNILIIQVIPTFFQDKKLKSMCV